MTSRSAVALDRWAAHRARFLREPLPIRLGELAVALSSAGSISEHPSSVRVVGHYLEVSQHYLEWTAPDTDAGLQAELAALRQLLTQWLSSWPAVWNNQQARAAMAAQVGNWSQKILERSGMLDPEINPR